jgi:hypothetical protein
MTATKIEKFFENLEPLYKELVDKQVLKLLIPDDSNSLQLRAAGLALAEQCVLFARISCGAVSLLEGHPITRISREIWQYTIAGYSEEQALAYLKFSIPDL